MDCFNEEKEAEQLRLIQNYVYNLFHDDATGHDFYHMGRVAQLARKISEQELANPFICEAAAWLHDVGDKKLFTNTDKAILNMNEFLESINITNRQRTKINNAIKDVSFSKGNNTPTTIEGKIVQDADRIDAIGAIGIARTFAYGGSKGQMIYHETDKQNTSIQHFYDKLLKLKELMHTRTAKKIAIERHLFLEDFLKQFFKEW